MAGDWCGLKVRVDCPECGSAVLVDGPYKKVACTACDARISLAGIWKWVVDRALEDGAGGQHFRLSTLLQTGKGGLGAIYVGLNRGHPPVCSTCNEVLDEVDGGVADGHDGDFHCPACGGAHPTWPAPPYLKQCKATQVFMAPKEDEQSAMLTPVAEAKPVMFACPNCGANLRITGDTKRVSTVDTYLPAALWNQLHPVRRRRAFWLRLSRGGASSGGKK